MASPLVVGLGARMHVHVYNCATWHVVEEGVCCSQFVFMGAPLERVQPQFMCLFACACLLTEAWHGLCAVSCPRVMRVMAAALL
jgi:hypothetical protein